MRKIIKNIVFTILFLSLITATALLTYLHFFTSGDSDLSGRWSAKVDMTERATVTAFTWLQDIEAVSVSLDDLETSMQGLSVEIDLALEQTTHSAGTFRCNVRPESYDACSQAAYEAFAAAFQALLAERLLMAGYTADTGEEAIEALVTETFGMSTVAYLMTCVPGLLPPLEDLQAQYDGSGTYETAEGILTRRFDAGQTAAEKAEYYIRKDSTLILSEESSSEHDYMIYILQEP